jgi:hypothetical protein
MTAAAIQTDCPIVDPVLYRIEERNRLGEWRVHSRAFDLAEARRIANRKPDRRILRITKEIVE